MQDSKPTDGTRRRDSEWRRSSHCANSGCVEVNVAEPVVQVRDSKAPDGPVLHFEAGEWRSFVAGVKNGEFDN